MTFSLLPLGVLVESLHNPVDQSVRNDDRGFKREAGMDYCSVPIGFQSYPRFVSVFQSQTRQIRKHPAAWSYADCALKPIATIALAVCPDFISNLPQISKPCSAPLVMWYLSFVIANAFHILWQAKCGYSFTYANYASACLQRPHGMWSLVWDFLFIAFAVRHSFFLSKDDPVTIACCFGLDWCRSRSDARDFGN